MAKFARLASLLSVISLSLFSGAFLFIAFVMLKFWQAIEPDIFLNWMEDHFFRLPMLMVPLNMTVLLLTLAAFAVGWKTSSRLSLGLSAAFILMCTLTFPIYFAGANATFLNRELPLSEISSAIATWSTWHWIRTGLALISLIFASVGLFQHSSAHQSTSQTTS